MKALRVKFLFESELYKENKLPTQICAFFPPLAFSFAIELACSLFELRESSSSCCIVFELRKNTSVYFAEETLAFTFTAKEGSSGYKTINEKTPYASFVANLDPEN